MNENLLSEDGGTKLKYRRKSTEREHSLSGDGYREEQVRTQKESDRARGTYRLETASGGISQGAERIRPSEGHSPTGDGIEGQVSTETLRASEGHSQSEDGIGRDKSGHRESDRARGTHNLKTASGGTSQDTERIRPSKGNSPTGVGIGRDKSERGKNPTKRGALTNSSRNWERQVRTRKESDRATYTHELKSESGETSQNTERIQLSKGNSLSGDRIGGDKSGRGKNLTERGALTSWRRHRDEQVRIQKESDRARGTHILELELGGTSQNTEGI